MKGDPLNAEGTTAAEASSLYTARPLTARPRRAPKALRDQPPCGTNRFYGTTLEPRAGGAYGTSLLTGRRCWDEPPYEAEALGDLGCFFLSQEATKEEL